MRLSLLALVYGAALFAPISKAAAHVAMDASGMGLVILGFDSRICDSSLEGALRYDSSTNNIQACKPVSGNCASAAGTTCNDGAIYVGPSPDNGDPMYTTTSDAPGLLPWNYMGITGDYTNTSMVDCSGFQSSCVTGESNTNILVTEDSNSNLAGAQDHEAAQYCYDLSAHGHSDWYLPAESELELMYAERASGALAGTFNETGSFSTTVYWSSSENDLDSVRYVDFDGGSTFNRDKNNDHSVRCVRKSSLVIESNSYQWLSWGD